MSRLPWHVLPDRIHGLSRTASPLPPASPAPPRAGTCAVQLLRTYPRRRPRYPYAPQGERSIALAYAKALGRAQQLIYVEDQYLWSFDVARIFAAALHRSSRLHLIAVVPRRPDNENQLYNESAMLGHAEALAMVREAGEDRVQVLDVENLQGLPVYVHSKLCVVDDVWAAVGSDNFNMRSWTHDSELTAAVLDGERDRRAPTDPGGLGDGARRFARELRLTLMREHLELDEEDELLDPARAADIVRKSVAELDAWHDGGCQGPRPAGRVRSHPIGKGARCPPGIAGSRPRSTGPCSIRTVALWTCGCAVRTDLVSLRRAFGQIELRRLSRLQLPRRAGEAAPGDLSNELRSGAVEPVGADQFETDRPHRAEMHGNGVVGVELGEEAGGARRVEVPGAQRRTPAADRQQGDVAAPDRLPHHGRAVGVAGEVGAALATHHVPEGRCSSPGPGPTAAVVLGRNHLDDEIPHADGVTRCYLDQFAVTQPPQTGDSPQRTSRNRHRHVPRQGSKRREVEMVGMQVRHDGQIGTARPVVGQRPPPATKVPQPRAEQRVGEHTNATILDRAGRVPPPRDIRHRAQGRRRGRHSPARAVIPLG